eukprot:CAMPEP_0119127256 /NCGR_PEP_ID=MMETSP1310-20130426/5876_1 /TAXON_ID=464262 /ORGANISM="Genus nov. species nov., Strain RCC2339" /LENGTH=60 /DNA_ID=CAMNT_0007117501 /DNA_START=37 /DNA_END=215 /DNA_ORIENTATION=-
MSSKYMRAKWNFGARSRFEISLLEGEVVQVVEEDGTQWWKGERANGSVGLFPVVYCEEAG